MTLVAPAPLPTSSPGDPRYPGTQHHLVLIDLIERNGWSRGAEIGLLKGKTFRHVLDACPYLDMIGVDAWVHRAPTDEDGSETYHRFDMAAAEAACRDIADRAGPRATIMKGESLEVVALVPDASLDFVFIDAGHTTSAVAADIRAWAPKVRPDGWLIGHDWWFPSVQVALDDMLPGWVRHEHSVWSIPAVDIAL